MATRLNDSTSLPRPSRHVDREPAPLTGPVRELEADALALKLEEDLEVVRWRVTDRVEVRLCLGGRPLLGTVLVHAGESRGEQLLHVTDGVRMRPGERLTILQ